MNDVVYNYENVETVDAETLVSIFIMCFIPH